MGRCEHKKGNGKIEKEYEPKQEKKKKNGKREQKKICPRNGPIVDDQRERSHLLTTSTNCDRGGVLQTSGQSAQLAVVSKLELLVRPSDFGRKHEVDRPLTANIDPQSITTKVVERHKYAI